MSSEPALMSLTAVAKAIAEKRVSSREVTQSLLDRIAQWQPKLNAFMSVEADDALKAADSADAALAKGGPKGALHGVPLAQGFEAKPSEVWLGIWDELRNWIATAAA